MSRIVDPQNGIEEYLGPQYDHGNAPMLLADLIFDHINSEAGNASWGPNAEIMFKHTRIMGGFLDVSARFFEFDVAVLNYRHPGSTNYYYVPTYLEGDAQCFFRDYELRLNGISVKVLTTSGPVKYHIRLQNTTHRRKDQDWYLGGPDRGNYVRFDGAGMTATSTGSTPYPVTFTYQTDYRSRMRMFYEDHLGTDLMGPPSVVDLGAAPTVAKTTKLVMVPDFSPFSKQQMNQLIPAGTLSNIQELFRTEQTYLALVTEVDDSIADSTLTYSDYTISNFWMNNVYSIPRGQGADRVAESLLASSVQGLPASAAVYWKLPVNGYYSTTLSMSTGLTNYTQPVPITASACSAMHLYFYEGALRSNVKSNMRYYKWSNSVQPFSGDENDTPSTTKYNVGMQFFWLNVNGKMYRNVGYTEVNMSYLPTAGVDGTYYTGGSVAATQTTQDWGRVTYAYLRAACGSLRDYSYNEFMPEMDAEYWANSVEILVNFSSDTVSAASVWYSLQYKGVGCSHWRISYPFVPPMLRVRGVMSGVSISGTQAQIQLQFPGSLYVQYNVEVICDVVTHIICNGPTVTYTV